MYAVRGLGLSPNSVPSVAAWFAATLGPVTAGTVDYCSQGRLNWMTNAKCWGAPLDRWQSLKASTYTAAPPAPSDLLVDPANYRAQELIQSLADDQMRRQQGLNAEGVDEVWTPPGTAAFLNFSDSLDPSNWFDGVNWWVIGGVAALSVFALTAIGGGRPRRYGR